VGIKGIHVTKPDFWQSGKRLFIMFQRVKKSSIAVSQAAVYLNSVTMVSLSVISLMTVVFFDMCPFLSHIFNPKCGMLTTLCVELADTSDRKFFVLFSPSK
jgi:hypothetical protein